MAKEKIENYKAICGETFTFRAETIENLVKIIAEKVENPNSNFSYFDAGDIIEKELADKLIEVANEKSKKLNELIADIMARRKEQADN